MVSDILFRRLRLIQSYRRLFDTPDGQVVLRHLMSEGFMLKSTFVAGDPQQTALNEGSRRVVLGIMKYALKDDSELTKQVLQAQQEKGE